MEWALNGPNFMQIPAQIKANGSCFDQAHIFYRSTKWLPLNFQANIWSLWSETWNCLLCWIWYFRPAILEFSWSEAFSSRHLLVLMCLRLNCHPTTTLWTSCPTWNYWPYSASACTHPDQLALRHFTTFSPSLSGRPPKTSDLALFTIHFSRCFLPAKFHGHSHTGSNSVFQDFSCR